MLHSIDASYVGLLPLRTHTIHRTTTHAIPVMYIISTLLIDRECTFQALTIGTISDQMRVMRNIQILRVILMVMGCATCSPVGGVPADASIPDAWRVDEPTAVYSLCLPGQGCNLTMTNAMRQAAPDVTCIAYCPESVVSY